MKKRHATQRQLAAAGKAREIERYKREFNRRYDSEPGLCAAFVRGLMMENARRFLRPTDAEAREFLASFISENNLTGELLIEALELKLRS